MLQTLAKRASSILSKPAKTLWGHGVGVDYTSVNSALGCAPEALKTMPVREALRAVDRLMGSITVSEIVPPDSNTLIDLDRVDLMIPADKILKGIVFDEDWLDVALQHFFDTSPGPTLEDCVPEFFTDLCKHTYLQTVRFKNNVLGNTFNDYHVWPHNYQLTVASSIYFFSRWHGPERLGRLFPLAPDGLQVLTLTLDSHTPPYEMPLACDEELFETRQFHTLPTMVDFVRNLEHKKVKQGGGKVIETIGFAMPDIFKRAYFSSVSKNTVVWVGHPALYTVGYSRNGYLYLSGWRSCNPERIAALLHDPISITLSEDTAETVALATLGFPTPFEAFLTKTHRPLPIPTAQPDIWVSHFFSESIQAIRNLPFTRVVLGGMNVYGHWTEESGLPNISTTELTSFPKTVDLDFRIWKNTFAVAKMVGSKELQALRELQGIDGIPILFGSLEVAVSDPSAHGTEYPFYVAITANVGLSVHDIDYEIDGAVDELLDEEVYDQATRKILRGMHERGWHHHLIYDGSILQDKDGKVYLTDFEYAKRAEECNSARNHCDDREILAKSRHALIRNRAFLHQ